MASRRTYASNPRINIPEERRRRLRNKRSVDAKVTLFVERQPVVVVKKNKRELAAARHARNQARAKERVKKEQMSTMFLNALDNHVDFVAQACAFNIWYIEMMEQQYEDDEWERRREEEYVPPPWQYSVSEYSVSEYSVSQYSDSSREGYNSFDEYYSDD